MAYHLAGIIFVVWYSLCFSRATRFLPMVVWDHLNPILSGQPNSLKIPEVDRYDRVDFVCPTLKISVNLLDGYSRPTEEMNENLFRMKWNGTEDELKNHIKNETLHSFCDPKSSVVDRLYSCKNGEVGKGFAVTFKPNYYEEKKNYENDEIYIFFNNGDDGKFRTLSSKTKKCTMLFPVKVTKTAANKKHDMSYGKSWSPNVKTETNTCHTSEDESPIIQTEICQPYLPERVSPKVRMAQSSRIQDFKTGSLSMNNSTLIVIIVILSVVSTTFLLVIILLILRGKPQESRREHSNAHYVNSQPV